jgi:GcrA cell cycle regulator
MWVHCARLAPCCSLRSYVTASRAKLPQLVSECVSGGVVLPAKIEHSIKPSRLLRGSSMSWTDERVELLKKLWSDGLSASRIAAVLGGITRNAVIGKVHRLGLSGRAKSASAAASHQRKARSSSYALRMSRASIRGNTALAHVYDYDVKATPELIENIIPIGQRRSLTELTEKTCHWPYRRRPALLRLPLPHRLSAGG